MKNILLVLVFTGIGCAGIAQDTQFSQYYQAPLYLNPGFTGLHSGHRIVLNHRLQWPNLPQVFSTYASSYDVMIPKIKSGVGILLGTDKMGSADWRSTNLAILYSYKIRLNDNIVFSPGISFGYSANGLDRSKLMMGDGLNNGGNSIDPKLNNIRGQQYWDFGSGFVFYAKQLWLGASFAHMNRPNTSLIGETSRLDVKTSVHGGVRLDMTSNVRSFRTVYFTPSFIYTMQGNIFSQLDLGVNFHVDPVSVGVWYRGTHLPQNSSLINSDALILFMGLYLKKFIVGYSYDFTISQLATTSGGAHEISLTYQLPHKKTLSKNRLIPCPAFYSDRY